MATQRVPTIPPAPKPPAPELFVHSGFRAPEPGPSPTPKTNGLAVGSLICGILGLVLPALILGYIALGQINRSEHEMRGHGLAVMGVMLGWLWIPALVVIAWVR